MPSGPKMINKVTAFDQSTEISAVGGRGEKTGSCLGVQRGTLTCVLHFHISKGLQGVLIGDSVKVQGPHRVIHLLGLGDEFVRELLDLLGGQVPAQAVIGADLPRAAKHHLSCHSREKMVRNVILMM